MSIDAWTSQNDLGFLAFNATWCGPDMRVYRALIEFIQIDGSHSRENMAFTVFKRLKKLNILQKLLTVTADNAFNNDTCVDHLHSMMSRKYDDHLDPYPTREGLMRFKGEKSQIRCFAHILNLVAKAILDHLGSSNATDHRAFLDRAVANKWSKITLPGAQGVIAKLRVQVLWVDRSPQRQDDWINRPNVKRNIPVDVQHRWNYTLLMYEVAETHRAALDDLVSDNPILDPLRLTNSDWKQIKDLQRVLKPFEIYTNRVSYVKPSIQMASRMYFKLEKHLKAITRKEGV